MVELVDVSSDLRIPDMQLFRNIVPDSTAKAVSRYTDMRDSRIRELLNAVERLSDEARLRLAEYELPDLLHNAENNRGQLKLPAALQQEVDDFNKSGGVQSLRDSLNLSKRRRESCDTLLQEARRALENEASEDAQTRSRFGDNFRREGSSGASAELWYAMQLRCYL